MIKKLFSKSYLTQNTGQKSVMKLLQISQQKKRSLILHTTELMKFHINPSIYNPHHTKTPSHRHLYAVQWYHGLPHCLARQNHNPKRRWWRRNDIYWCKKRLKTLSMLFPRPRATQKLWKIILLYVMCPLRWIWIWFWKSRIDEFFWMRILSLLVYWTFSIWHETGLMLNELFFL